MLIIINDDSSYVAWIARHRQGFVIDAARKPKRNHIMLHRATCSIIKPHKRARLTTGAHLKACSLDSAELAAWALVETGSPPMACPECQPQQELCPADDHHATHRLTRLGRDVLSYVLDLAVMYLDGEENRYGPGVDAIATYLDKTPAQILPAIERLIEDGYLVRRCPPASGRGPEVIYPTARALRTIPAFDAMTENALVAELDGLYCA